MRFEMLFEDEVPCVRCFYPQCDWYATARTFMNGIHLHLKYQHEHWRNETPTYWKPQMEEYCHEVLQQFPGTHLSVFLEATPDGEIKSAAMYNHDKQEVHDLMM